jgi:hypothetical protein
MVKKLKNSTISPLSRVRNSYNNEILSAGEGWGEGIIQMFALSLTLSHA